MGGLSQRLPIATESSHCRSFNHSLAKSDSTLKKKAMAHWAVIIMYQFKSQFATSFQFGAPGQHTGRRDPCLLSS